jgi:hypothetical protein
MAGTMRAFAVSDTFQSGDEFSRGWSFKVGEYKTP